MGLKGASTERIEEKGKCEQKCMLCPVEAPYGSSFGALALFLFQPHAASREQRRAGLEPPAAQLEQASKQTVFININTSNYLDP